MVEDALNYCFFIIDAIVIDDDSTIQDLLKHLYIGDQGHVLK